jgi:hypothetical protein
VSLWARKGTSHGTSENRQSPTGDI